MAASLPSALISGASNKHKSRIVTQREKPSREQGTSGAGEETYVPSTLAINPITSSPSFSRLDCLVKINAYIYVYRASHLQIQSDLK